MNIKLHNIDHIEDEIVYVEFNGITYELDYDDLDFWDYAESCATGCGVTGGWEYPIYADIKVPVSEYVENEGVESIVQDILKSWTKEELQQKGNIIEF